MKRKILPVLSLLAAMTMVACGGTKSNTPGGKSSGKATSTSRSSAHRHTYGDTYQYDADGHWKMTNCTEHDPIAGEKEEHTFVEDKTDPEYVAATCKQGGVKVEKCSVCGYKRKTNVGPNYQLHNFGARTWTKTVATYDKTALSAATEMQVKKCSVCQEDDVILNALDFVNLDDAGKGVDGVKFNKVADGKRLKMASNNQYVEYKFTLDKDFAGKLYLYGVIDYWKTDNNQNHLKGFYPSTSPSGNEGTTCNVAIEVDGNDVEVTNKNSYLDMNIPDAGENPVGDGYSGFGLAEVGAITLGEGEHTLRYARKGSYNMDITEIHMIGTLTAHEHTFQYGEPVAEEGKSTYVVGTCNACGKKAVKWAVNTNTAGQTTTKRGTKLAANNNYFEYRFNYTGTLTGKLYVLAGVDSWSMNQDYGFFFNNTANLEFVVNDVPVTITNTKSYKDNGVQEGGDADEAKAHMMEVGLANLKDGENVIKVTRKESRSATIWDLFVIGK